MPNVLLISGSPRNGNTERILKRLHGAIGGELVLLRELRINHCHGCELCSETKVCVQHDDMPYETLMKADLIVIGTPNYFENVPGLLKDFIDRTNPLYASRGLKGKQLAVIVMGAMPKSNARVFRNGLECFAKAHKMQLVNEFCFKAGEELSGFDKMVNSFES